MEQVSKVNYKTDILSNLIQNYITKPDFNSAANNGSTWLMNFQTGAPKSAVCSNIYEGSSMQNTLCMRWKLEVSDLAISPVSLSKEAIWFKTEAV